MKTTKADLNTIKVIPGEFYLNKHGNLSYYHQDVVPGKIVDVAIKEYTPAIAQLMAELAAEQIKLAKEENAKRLTWEDVRKMVLKGIPDKKQDKRKPPAQPKKEPEVKELWPLEKESLQMLVKASSDKSVKLLAQAGYLDTGNPPHEQRLPGGQGNSRSNEGCCCQTAQGRPIR